MAASTDRAQLASMAQCVDENCESRGRLTTARVPQMVAWTRKAPVVQYALAAPAGEVGLRHAFRHIGEPQSSQGRTEHLRRRIEDELTLYTDLQCPTALLELPGVEAAVRR